MTTTDKKASTTDWANVPFIDYLNQVDAIMEARYAMPSDERDVTIVAKRHEAGDTPRECVDWLSKEYDLEPLRVRTSDRTKRIAELNDQFRKSFLPPHLGGGKVFTTSGIEALTLHQKMTVLEKVREFDEFTPDNDPHGEHDFGAFDLPDVGKIFWKIDYYDLAMEQGSEDPANPEVTTRVLTIMLADEY